MVPPLVTIKVKDNQLILIEQLTTAVNLCDLKRLLSVASFCGVAPAPR